MGVLFILMFNLNKSIMKTKKASIVKTLSDYLRTNSANTETCQKLIDKCNKWIETNKQKEIEKIDKQISELQTIKESILNKM